MALCKKTDDDDLETLRLAALQTLGNNKQSTASSSRLSNALHQPQHSADPGLGTEAVFWRHRFNSNLTAIDLVNNEPSLGSDHTINQTMERQRAATVDDSTGHMLGLPQHQYCKTELGQENKLAGPTVSTKFSRHDDSNPDSSPDESEDENEACDKSFIGSGGDAELDDDPDMLIIAADEEELEAMNKSYSDVSVNTNVPVLSNSDNQKTKKFSHTSSSEYAKDKTVCVQESHVSSSCSSDHNKDNIFNEKVINAKSPIFSRKARSRFHHNCSPALLRSRRYGSHSPGSRFSYCPLRNRISRSPRSRMSRLPAYQSRTRSRSPVWSARSPRYSRSPPWHQSNSNHASRFSPQSCSPRPRILVSPRQSPSRLNRISPHRSPESRSLSPHLRQSFFSPSPNHFVSPLRMFFPSPSRGRYSCPSRSPKRFVSRGWSPARNRLLHHRSPVHHDERVEEEVERKRDGDLRAKLNRMRVERLTKTGSLHEIIPARLLHSALEGVVWKKGVKRIGNEDKMVDDKRTESKKEKSDVRCRRWINRWTQGNGGVWRKLAAARKRMIHRA